MIQITYTWRILTNDGLLKQPQAYPRNFFYTEEEAMEALEQNPYDLYEEYVLLKQHYKT